MIHRSILIIISGLFLSCRPDPSSTIEFPTVTPNESSKIYTIAFGSCNRQWEDQPIWDEVVKNEPDIWIWLGDIIYADTEDMSKFKADYETQKTNKGYQRLAAQSHVYGIWDDHDYGQNNAGRSYPKRDSSKTLLLDFLDVPIDHPSRERQGAYQSYNLDQAGVKIKLLLLDVRYFRDPLGSNGTILGQEQWKWLDNEMNDSDADIHLICGGIQFLPQDHRYEKWENFPDERSKLISLIDRHDVKNPILLSGDRHLAEMSLVPLPQNGDALLEVTSSGLTHSYRGFTEEKNRHRYGAVVASKNFGVLNVYKEDESISYKVTIKNDKNRSMVVLNSENLSAALENIIE